MIKLHRINAFLLRHLYEMRSSIDRKADVLFFPVIDILIFGLLTRYINEFSPGAGLAGAILSGIIFWTLVYNIVRDMAFTLLEDAWSRNLYNLFSTPLQLSETILGILAMSAMKGAVSIGVITGLAFWLFDFNAIGQGMLSAFYVLNIFIFAWAFGFMTTSLVLRFGTKVQAFAWSLILVIYPISGVFYPLSILPDFLAKVARVLPISYIFEGMRNLIITGQFPPASDFIVIVVLNCIYLALGIWAFVSGFKHAKARGWFIHPT